MIYKQYIAHAQKTPRAGVSERRRRVPSAPAGFSANVGRARTSPADGTRRAPLCAFSIYIDNLPRLTARMRNVHLKTKVKIAHHDSGRCTPPRYRTIAATEPRIRRATRASAGVVRGEDGREAADVASHQHCGSSASRISCYAGEGRALVTLLESRVPRPAARWRPPCSSSSHRR